MVKKTQKTDSDSSSDASQASSVKESAQQIWLAGLGAFSKAQQEGGKVFEALVKEGVAIQKKTQSAAEEKFAEATSKMSHMATDIQSKAGSQWDKLENIFEDRVAKALTRLGVPSAQEVEALRARIDELKSRVHKMSAGEKGKPGAGAAAKKTASRRPAARRSSTPE